MPACPAADAAPVVVGAHPRGDLHVDAHQGCHVEPEAAEHVREEDHREHHLEDAQEREVEVEADLDVGDVLAELEEAEEAQQADGPGTPLGLSVHFGLGAVQQRTKYCVLISGNKIF